MLGSQEKLYQFLQTHTARMEPAFKANMRAPNHSGGKEGRNGTSPVYILPVT